MATDSVQDENPAVDKSNCSNYYCVSDAEYIDKVIEYISPSAFEWTIVTLYAFVFVVGLIGNFLVCFVVYKNCHMRTTTNIFIVNLSVADIMVIVTCLPPTVISDITETWFLGRVGCKVIPYVQAVSVALSVLSLTAISLERFFAICHPFGSHLTPATSSISIGTRRARGITLICVWIASLVVMAPELVVMDTRRHLSPQLNTNLLTTCNPVGWSYGLQARYQLLITVVLYVAPLGVISVAYVSIAKTLWLVSSPNQIAGPCTYQLGAIVTTVTQTPAAQRHLTMTIISARRKVARMLIAVVITFAVCNLPVHLLNLLRYTKMLSDQNGVSFALVSHCLFYVNGAVNPVIYNCMSANFRRSFRTVCCTHSCRINPCYRSSQQSASSP